MPRNKKARKRKAVSKPPPAAKKMPCNNKDVLLVKAASNGHGKYKQWTEDAMLGAIRQSLKD